MSRTNVDERVVEMRFNNSQFEKNANDTLSTLEKLKQSLRFKDAGKGIEEIGNTASKFNMNGMSSAIEAVHAKFSALQVIGITTLTNLTNSAVNAGKRIVSALTIEPVKTGFQEYETQINAIQTILANTESKGSTLKDVNEALNELNRYADMTIYNFTEMTRNIGTFTAAGIELDTSVSAIKGIANLAAVSGSTSQQASTAMYQLSQALASGTVKLMDWNSVVNAGMGGQVFQDALKETARVHNIAIDDMIKSEGSFRETLKEGWLTSDILTETLSKFTGDLNEKQLKTMGYSDEQIKSIIKMGKTANDAATKVKTFTQLFDTLKEAAQSGWTQSWEIIVGDFEEAKALLTEISDVVSDMINKSAESRNALLKGWKDLGGRTALIDSFRNSFEALGSIIKPISEAFREIFPSITAEKLFSITEGLKNFTKSLKLSDEMADKLKRTFKGLFSVLDLLKRAITAVIKPIFSSTTFGAIKGLLDIILTITASIGDFLVTITNAKGVKDILSGISSGLSAIFGGIGKAIGLATDNIETFEEVLSAIGSLVSKVFNKITSVIGDVFSWISNNISAGDIFAGLAGGGIFAVAKKIKDMLNMISDPLEKLFGDKGKGKEKASVFKEIMESVHDTLTSFATGIKIASLIAIASSVAILSGAINSISKIDSKSLTKSLIAIGVMFEMLTISFRAISRSISKFGSKGIIKSSVSLIAMAKSIDIFATAMTKVAELDVEEIAKSLISLGSGLTMFVLVAKKLDKLKVSIKTSLAILAIAESTKILADSLYKFGQMSWDEIARGLTAMGGALAELSGTLIVLGKFGSGKLSSSLSILILVQALDEISTALSTLGKMSWEEIGRGLTAMGGALAELSGTVILLGKFGKHKISSSVSILILVKALSDISESLKKLGKMSWEEIGRGLTAMGVALAELGTVTTLLGKFGKHKISSSVSILILVKSLDDIAESLKIFGSMSWDEIGRGLSSMGGALAELGIITALLGKFGKHKISSSVSILILVKSLDDIASALEKFGFMSWDEIGRGLTAMGGALAELGIVTALLGKVGGFSSLIGATSILIVTQSLDKISDAMLKFGFMSWDEIGRGLTAMGGALTEVATIAGVAGYLAGFSGILGGASIWVTVQSLDKLALALEKFGSMSWDEIARGITAMGEAMTATAWGGFINSLSILGAFSIAEIAEPLGVLADSVKKWKDVVMPPTLKDDLSNLGDGIKSFNFTSIFGGTKGFKEIVEPLGTLADSVKKWKDVTMPENIGEDLSNLGYGIKSFNFASWFGGSGAFAEIAGPLGTLADSTKKWKDVLMPANIATDLYNLSEGVKSFNFASIFGGVSNFASVSEPLGSLADSVKKWKDVEMPDSIYEDLSNLGSGIKSFNFASWFDGTGSFNSIVGPFGALADSVKKWKDVVMPANIATDLYNLSNGIHSFDFASWFGGTGSFNQIVEPFGTLADSVKKWKDVVMPSNIYTDLLNLSNGIHSFDFASWLGGTYSFNEIVGPFGTLADSVKKWKDVTMPANIGTDLKNLGEGVKSFGSFFGGTSGAQSLATISGPLGDLAESIKKWKDVTIPKNFGDELRKVAAAMQCFSTQSNAYAMINMVAEPLGIMGESAMKWNNVKLPDGIKDSLKNLGEGIKAIEVDENTANNLSDVASKVESIYNALMNLNNISGERISTMITSILGSVKTIDIPEKELMTIGTKIIEKILEGIKTVEGKVSDTISGVLREISTKLESTKLTFYNIGLDAATGFANGIDANTFKARAKSIAMARAAAEAAKEELDEHSPSKVGYGIGDYFGIAFVNAIGDNVSKAYKVSAKMASSAQSGVTNVISKISDIVNSGMDMQPTIRPVIDTSGVIAGANSINGLLSNQSMNLATSVGAINTMMNRRIQNGNNSDILNAISDLNKDLKNLEKPSYNIGGITYDDGSNISDAVAELVRAIKMDRRS